LKTIYLSAVIIAMLLSSIEARAWSDNNSRSKDSFKDPDYKKPKDIFKEQDVKDDLYSKTILKDDKLVQQQDWFSSDTPVVLPKTTPQLQQGNPLGSNINAPGTSPSNIVVFEDKLQVAKPKETPPTIKRSDFYIGGRFQLESVNFDSSVASNLKEHHAYVEKAYPFSWGVEAALHRLHKYIYWNVGGFGQIDWAHKLSEKNTLNGSGSFGIFGHVGLSELIHIDQFRIIPAIGAEFNVAWQFKSVDISVMGSLYFVNSNVYLRLGLGKGLVPETFTLKNNDTDADETMKVHKAYGALSIGYWQ
jgi:hypothetical protein